MSLQKIPTVLVCDDDEGILDVITIILEEEGFKVFPVISAQNVMTQIHALQPDLILLDLWMPHIDGISLTQELQRKKSTQHIPILLLSAHNQLAQTAQKLGVSRYLAKPFDIDDLIKAVRACL
jgi:DNA-binding response OmpR family regulator